MRLSARIIYHKAREDDITRRGKRISYDTIKLYAAFVRQLIIVEDLTDDELENRSSHEVCNPVA